MLFVFGVQSQSVLHVEGYRVPGRILSWAAELLATKNLKRQPKIPEPTTLPVTTLRTLGRTDHCRAFRSTRL